MCARFETITHLTVIREITDVIVSSALEFLADCIIRTLLGGESMGFVYICVEGFCCLLWWWEDEIRGLGYPVVKNLCRRWYNCRWQKLGYPGTLIIVNSYGSETRIRKYPRAIPGYFFSPTDGVRLAGVFYQFFFFWLFLVSDECMSVLYQSIITLYHYQRPQERGTPPHYHNNLKTGYTQPQPNSSLSIL